MPSNVIELIVRTVDQATAPLKKISNTVTGMGAQIKSAFSGIGKLSLGVALGSLIERGVHAAIQGVINGIRGVIEATKEAQRTTAQLDAAFKATGSGLGLTSARLDELASEIQRTTIYEDDLVKGAESVLLTFDKVRGQAFERTIKAAVDLSARLGTDLVGSVKQVGFALQDPETGLLRLRRAGIAFTAAERDMIKEMVAAGDIMKAQDVILQSLEKRFAGSAVAARNTLGGALEALKNAFNNLKEGSEDTTAGIVSSINEMTDTMEDPSVKAGAEKIQKLIFGIGSVALSTVGAISDLIDMLQRFALVGGNELEDLDDDIKRVQDNIEAFSKKGPWSLAFDTEANEKEVVRLRIELARLNSERDKMLGQSQLLPGRGHNAPRIDQAVEQQAVQALSEEFEKLEQSLEKQIALFGDTGKAAEIAYETTRGELQALLPEDKKRLQVLAAQLDALKAQGDVIDRLTVVVSGATRMNEEWAQSIEATGTASQKAQLDYVASMATLQQQFEKGDISAEEFNKRLEGIFEDAGLVEFKLADFDDKRIVTQVTGAFDSIQAIADRTAENVQDAFGEFLRFDWLEDDEGIRGFFKNILDLARTTLAEITSEILLTSMGGTKGIAAGIMKLLGGGAKTGAAAGAAGAATTAVATQTTQAAVANLQSPVTQVSGPVTVPSMNVQAGNVTLTAASLLATIQQCISNCASCIGGGSEGGGILDSLVRAGVGAIPGLGAVASAAGGAYAPGVGDVGPYLPPPGRAAGGPVKAGETYTVGEKGVETLTMGSQSGYITPNHKMGGTQVYAPVYNIKVDSRADRAAVIQDVGAILEETDRIKAQRQIDQASRGRRL